MSDRYIKVYSYTHFPSGFGSRAPVTRYSVTICNEGASKEIGRDMEEHHARNQAQEWSTLIGFEIRYFKEKRVTTVSEEEVGDFPQPKTRRELSNE